MPPNTIDTMTDTAHFQNNHVTQMEMTSKNKLRWYQTETQIIWRNVIFVVALHIAALYYFITFPYFQHKFLMVWTFCTAHLTGLGITGGAHRLWAHNTYKANTLLRIFLAMCFYSAGQNTIHDWVRDHRVHHKYTDTEADPHDNNRGFWFSHVGWLMLKKKDEVRKRGKGIYMTDILEDPVAQFFDRNFKILSPLFTFIIPIFVPVYFLNQDLKWTFVSQVFMRYTWLLNTTWSVNSFAHMFGYHSYDKSIRPTQNIYVAFVAGGEGWHNYHHVFPWDYKAAEFKGIFNITTSWIDLFAKIGWAFDLRHATPDHIRKVIERRGDGTHNTINESPKTIKSS